MTRDPDERLCGLEQRISRLEAESSIRRVMARYMALCDEPMTTAPGPGFPDLFTEDLVWEGGEFATVEGREALLAWFATMRKPDALHYSRNIHFLASEAIEVGDGEAVGNWLLLQPALLGNGSGELRLARLCVIFRRGDDIWRIAHFCTETLLKIEVDAGRTRELLAMVKS